jgi:phosphopantetheinyl transferase
MFRDTTALLEKQSSKSPGDPPSHLLVDLWTMDLDACAEQYSILRTLLSLDEKERSLAYRFEKDRIRFTTCRAALRLILGNTYLHQPPHTIRFQYGPYGKPSLAFPD